MIRVLCVPANRCMVEPGLLLLETCAVDINIGIESSVLPEFWFIRSFHPLLVRLTLLGLKRNGRFLYLFFYSQHYSSWNISNLYEEAPNCSSLVKCSNSGSRIIRIWIKSDMKTDFFLVKNGNSEWRLVLEVDAMLW